MKYESLGGLSERIALLMVIKLISLLFIRLYKSKAGTSMLFARTIRDSLEMQKYFGIYVKESAPLGRNFDDLPIYFNDKRFKLIPNSAHLTWDIDNNKKYEFMLKKDSYPDTKKEFLTKFFKKLIRFVQDEFKIHLEFNGEISI